MITSTVSQEIRRPMTKVIKNLEDLEQMVKGNEQASLMARESKNSSKLFIFLVYDMLDIFNFKNEKFSRVEEKVVVRDVLEYIVELFKHKCSRKEITLEFQVGDNVPETFMSDVRRLQ